jgi:Family of unknown function (DUF5682)
LTLLDRAASTEAWLRAVLALADDSAGDNLLRGFAARTLYDRGALTVEATGAHLGRALSPSAAPLEAGRWLEGFLGNAGQVLLHDAELQALIDGWLAALDEETFMNLLPMLRRAFSSLDRTERRRLLDAAGRAPAARVGTALSAESGNEFAPGFAAALPLLLTILGLDGAQSWAPHPRRSGCGAGALRSAAKIPLGSVRVTAGSTRLWPGSTTSMRRARAPAGGAAALAALRRRRALAR